MADLYPIAFRAGDPNREAVDFTKQEIDRWQSQIEWWVKESQPREEDPPGKAAKIMNAALNGTKINGEIWAGIDAYSLKSRIKMLCGWDIETGKGNSSYLRNRKRVDPDAPFPKKAKEDRAKNEVALADLSAAEMMTRREEIKATILQQFPWLDTPIYESKVNALAEAEVRLESLSDQFLTIDAIKLEPILKVKELLRKDINELMELLSIHPKQLKHRVDEVDRGDVGNLIVQFEKYGEIAKDWELVDAIQELIQAVRASHNYRIDGSPQWASWYLWHLTGCGGHNFKCECGREYELYNGFTIEELEQAAEQAYRLFGFGLKRVEDDVSRQGTEATEVEPEADPGTEDVPEQVRESGSAVEAEPDPSS